MKLILPILGVVINAELTIREDGSVLSIRAYCESEKDTQCLFNNIINEELYVIKRDCILIMKEHLMSSTVIDLEKKLVKFKCDYIDTISSREKKKVFIQLARSRHNV